MIWLYDIVYAMCFIVHANDFFFYPAIQRIQNKHINIE